MEDGLFYVLHIWDKVALEVKEVYMEGNLVGGGGWRWAEKDSVVVLDWTTLRSPRSTRHVVTFC